MQLHTLNFHQKFELLLYKEKCCSSDQEMVDIQNTTLVIK